MNIKTIFRSLSLAIALTALTFTISSCTSQAGHGHAPGMHGHHPDDGHNH